MSELSQDAQQDLVSDLSSFFNQLAHAYTKPQAPTSAAFDAVSSDFATIIDFKTRDTAATQLRSHVVRKHAFASADLIAIEFINHFNMRGTTDQVVPVLYQAMKKISDANGVSFYVSQRFQRYV